MYLMRVVDFALEDGRGSFDGFLYGDEFHGFSKGQVDNEPGLICYCLEDFCLCGF